MQINFSEIKTPSNGACVVFVKKDLAFEGLAAELNAQADDRLKTIFEAANFAGAKASSLEILAPAGCDFERLLVIGLGDSKLSKQDNIELGALATAKLLHSGSSDAFIAVDFEGADAAAIAEGAMLRSYRFDKYRTKEPESKKPSLTSITVMTTDESATKVFEDRSKVVDGVFFTRDLVSEPGNVLYPESFADRIRELTRLGVEVEVLGEAEMETLGMGSLLCVGQGSARESQLAIMRWNGGNAGDAPLAFIGKGVTFDTGGISLKPGAGMEQMKWDMGGAGTVVGLMKALAGRKAKANVVAVVGLVENMPSGNATRPGDVVTSMSGQTIEVLNTDAEGRLVLADALWYCQETYKPKFMIDLATLTGAMIISLGHEYAGIFSDSDELSDQLYAAGIETGDKVWRLPIHDNYDKLINCDVADMKNIGGRAAGSITAAQFLKRFTNDVPWVHIDIAGTVWSEKDLPMSEKGGTGHGVRLLDRFVADNYEN
ncbi:leucyl aminopeptidase [Kordiimonas sp. SCSIO 12610]|uniref:leucyl aminopeptidase n=1 Tax=Kordiimonas sp. SCSIO 12610 TaxID=2829597 RepID=UPI00210B898C|nr:leucyl aminopeptidase [Kordiimonas sp. SCSIO 12610]UTW53877.1 leucyl aminopeptidase [Kordiimonas sp. SCSIO 12610]